MGKLRWQAWVGVIGVAAAVVAAWPAQADGTLRRLATLLETGR